MKYINSRDSVFWKGAFLQAYGELLRREPPTDKVLAGARIAALACNMADDCERARTSGGAACAECSGVGCEVCRFTGKADAGDGLHAPAVERSLTLVGRAVSAEVAETAVAGSVDALAIAIGQADRGTEVKRRERFGAKIGTKDDPQEGGSS
jgi:hypothetical protein